MDTEAEDEAVLVRMAAGGLTSGLDCLDDSSDEEEDDPSAFREEKALADLDVGAELVDAESSSSSGNGAPRFRVGTSP